MGLITLTDPVTLTTVASGLVATNNANLRAVLNGGIDNTNIAAAAAILGSKIQFSVGTSPPLSPSDGDLWLYSNSPTYWLFRYVAAEPTYKWVFIGSAPLIATVQTQENTASGTDVDLFTVGPSVSIPRAGDYIVRFGFTAVTLGPSNAGNAGATLYLNNVTTGVTAAVNMPNVTGAAMPAAREWSLNGTSVNVLKPKFSISNGVSTGFGSRFLAVTPVRVI